MSYLELLRWWLAPFVVVLSIIFLASKCLWSKLWTKPPWIIGAVLCGVTHLIMATTMLVYIAVGLKRERLFGLTWALFLVGDYPISVLMRPMIDFFDGALSGILDMAFSSTSGIAKSNVLFWFSNLITPYVLFATVGGLQYCLWGGLIGKILEKVRRTRA